MCKTSIATVHSGRIDPLNTCVRNAPLFHTVHKSRFLAHDEWLHPQAINHLLTRL